MAHLSLSNSTLLKGIDFTNDLQLNSILSAPDKKCFLLFPGNDAQDISELSEHSADGRTEVFIILDATWAMAKKMFRASQNLQKIPQVMFTPSTASEFVIRKQPDPHCFSTIETIHHILQLRGLPTDGESQNLLDIFRRMVQQQIAYEEARVE